MDSIQFILILGLFFTILVIPYIIKNLILFKPIGINYATLAVAVFSLLYYLALPNYRSYEPAKITRVKFNEHTLKTIVDTYYADNKSYPKNIDELKKEALKSRDPYWKELKNPFTENKGKGKSYDDFQRILINEKITFPELRKAGVVYYSPIFNKKGQVIKYFIYGSEKDGFLIKDYSGKDKFFTLTNE